MLSLIPVSLLRGIAESANAFLFAAVFSYGSYAVQYENLSFHLLYRVFMVINNAAAVVARRNASRSHFMEAKLGATRLFTLLDQQPAIQYDSNEGKQLDNFSGRIDISAVSFSYESRPDTRVLNALSMSMQPDTKTAIVGESGCGKSTITSLIERFYDPTEGCISADGVDIRTLDLQWYRHQIGLVEQEPILFNRSIAENIRYGDNTRTISIEEIIEVSKMVNLHNFISQLPKGYDTNVGDLGTQLSGGEKQRVAIARALIRNPKILVLDEATSALDTHNEKVVKDVLKQSGTGRTTIVIAHRLATIEDSDNIISLEGAGSED